MLGEILKHLHTTLFNLSTHLLLRALGCAGDGAGLGLVGVEGVDPALTGPYAMNDPFFGGGMEDSITESAGLCVCGCVCVCLVRERGFGLGLRETDRHWLLFGRSERRVGLG